MDIQQLFYKLKEINGRLFDLLIKKYCDKLSASDKKEIAVIKTNIATIESSISNEIPIIIDTIQLSQKYIKELTNEEK